MTHCAKCGAELIGLRKFCTACGAPAGDPRSPAGATGQQPSARGSQPSISAVAPNVSPAIRYAAAAPPSAVNPFAQTAGPENLPVLAAPVDVSGHAPAGAGADGSPPSTPFELATTTPGVGDPSKAPQVSPLATSNIDSERGGMVDAIVASARAERAGSAPPPPPQRAPGTQLMPSMASGAPPLPPRPNPTPSSAPEAPKKRMPATQLMSAPAALARSGSNPEIAPSGGASPSTPAQSVAAPSAPAPYVAPAPAPYAAPAPAPYAAPAPAAYAAPYAAPAPAPYAGPAPYPAATPSHPAVGYPPQPPAYGYGYAGLVPGSRVSVTWANGHRYPGTVQQIAGSQCLVVFPDGQLHWVDMQYVAPG
ncbi:MAG: hypothetical protein JWP97_3424 [Labilithrix sp.]|nr:hypothetical protein [Labilithrix sp.]